jgi:hypothetical protein
MAGQAQRSEIVVAEVMTSQRIKIITPKGFTAGKQRLRDVKVVTALSITISFALTAPSLSK